MEEVTRMGMRNYEVVQDWIYPRLISLEFDRSMLSLFPHRMYEDLVMIYVVLEGDKLIPINWWMCEAWQVDEETLNQHAKINAAMDFPVRFVEMNEMLAMLTHSDVSAVCDGEHLFEVYVMLPEGGPCGAACLFCDDVFSAATSVMNGSFYILPSSVHEVLLIQDMGGDQGQSLQKIVQEINDEELAPDDRLSYQVYHYDDEFECFETADAFERRRRNMEMDVE